MPQTKILVYRRLDGRIPFQEWFDDLKKSDRRVWVKLNQRILQLSREGHEMRRPSAAHLERGIYELRVQVGTVNWRILYFFSVGRNTAVLSHGLSKEREVPSNDIDLASSRKGQVEKNPENFAAVYTL